MNNRFVQIFTELQYTSYVLKKLIINIHSNTKH